MNKWLCGVLAAFVGVPAAQARTTGEGWTTLDEEIDRLVSSQPAQSAGPALGVLLRPLYVMADQDEDEGGDGDIGGFVLGEADAWLQGTVSDVSWRLSTDFDSGTASLEDAYALMNLTNEVALTFGHFKIPALHASRIDPEHQMFLERPWLAQGFDFWDNGAMVDATSGQFAGFFAIQNGETGIEAKHSYLLRLEMMLNAAAAASRNWTLRTTGLLDNNATRVGVFHYEDDVVSDAQVNGIDVAASFNNWRVEAEAIDVDEDAPTGWIVSPDSTPWDIGGEYAVNQNFNVGVRFQDADDSADTSGITLGVDYKPGDPSVYWSFEVDLIDSDDDGRDGEVFRVGLTVGGTRTR